MKWPKVSGNHDLENGRPGKLGKVTPVDQSSPSEKSHNISVETKGTGGSVIQVETLGKVGLLVLLGMFCVMIIIALVVGYSMGVGQARYEDLTVYMRTVNGKAEVAQYDVNTLRSQLIAKGLIEHTGH